MTGLGKNSSCCLGFCLCKFVVFGTRYIAHVVSGTLYITEQGKVLLARKIRELIVSGNEGVVWVRVESLDLSVAIEPILIPLTALNGIRVASVVL